MAYGGIYELAKTLDSLTTEPIVTTWPTGCRIGCMGLATFIEGTEIGKDECGLRCVRITHESLVSARYTGPWVKRSVGRPTRRGRSEVREDTAQRLIVLLQSGSRDEVNVYARGGTVVLSLGQPIRDEAGHPLCDRHWQPTPYLVRSIRPPAQPA